MVDINDIAMQLLIDENKRLANGRINAQIEAINTFVNYVVESGQLSGSDNKFLMDFAKEINAIHEESK